MTAVRLWTGREARALRRALRLSVRAFAEHLGVGARTVSKWEQLGNEIVPRPDTQAILDTALSQSDADQRIRFDLLLNEFGGRVPTRDEVASELRAWEYESWTEDLERAVVALSRQDFGTASGLLGRWLARYPVGQSDPKGLYLRARSLSLLGDSRRDQGALLGPLSAQHSYRQALNMFSELDVSRRVAQLELSLVVIAEMAGDLQGAARRYQQLAEDERLSERDRARSRLWVGTALSKAGEHEYAAHVMTWASQQFEDLGETEDWATAQQKLALAYRGAGALDQALHFISIARSGITAETPMHRVRLATAHAHILLSDVGTRDDGHRMLEQTGALAAASGLVHQLRSIKTIGRGFERAG